MAQAASSGIDLSLYGVPASSSRSEPADKETSRAKPRGSDKAEPEESESVEGALDGSPAAEDLTDEDEIEAGDGEEKGSGAADEPTELDEDEALKSRADKRFKALAKEEGLEQIDDPALKKTMSRMLKRLARTETQAARYQGEKDKFRADMQKRMTELWGEYQKAKGQLEAAAGKNGNTVDDDDDEIDIADDGLITGADLKKIMARTRKKQKSGAAAPSGNDAVKAFGDVETAIINNLSDVPTVNAYLSEHKLGDSDKVFNNLPSRLARYGYAVAHQAMSGKLKKEFDRGKAAGLKEAKRIASTQEKIPDTGGSRSGAQKPKFQPQGHFEDFFSRMGKELGFELEVTEGKR